MRTYIQRFSAQILLFSGLLQSCYSPHVVDVPEEAAMASVEVADSHAIDADPHTHKRKLTSAEPIPDASGPADHEPSASHPAATFPKSLRLDAGQGPQEIGSPTSLAQAGGPGRSSASIQPKICTGTDRFDKLLLKSDVFVDKSLFIKEFLESQEEVTLITRPRRWGKSLNMDMLKRFLNIEVDDQGKPLPQEQSLNRKLFVGGEVVIGPKTGKLKQLPPLKIAQQCPDLINDYQGQYPVISIGFKDVKGSSYQAIEAGVKTQIIDLYTEGSYLYPCIQAVRTTLEGAQKEQLRRYIDGAFDEEDIKNSLRFLSKLLYKHFQKPVYILIDEYDAPINNAYVKCKDRPEEFQKILELFQNLLGATLKSNPYLEQSLVTGILRIAKSNLFSDLNNMQEFTLLDQGFATCYGFTQQEVNELLSQVPVSTSSDDIRKWYNGYTFEEQVLYNPWSIMCCLRHKGRLDCYWIDSGGTQLIDSVLLSDEVQHKLQALILGQSITSTIEKHISFDALAEPDTEPLYSLLLFGGYLNPDVALPGLDGDTYQLSIPNHEVGYIYKRRLLEWVRKKLKVTSDQYRDLVMLLATGQVESFTEQLQDLLSQSTSFHQVGPQRSEVFYSGFMFGLLNILSNHYIIESERESGLGRPDAVLIPRVEYGDCALIIEYKVSKQVEQLATLAERALVQIVDKAYSTQLKSHNHIKKVLQVGLAFCGKQVASKYERVDL